MPWLSFLKYKATKFLTSFCRMSWHNFLYYNNVLRQFCCCLLLLFGMSVNYVYYNILKSSICKINLDVLFHRPRTIKINEIIGNINTNTQRKTVIEWEFDQRKCFALFQVGKEKLLMESTADSNTSAMKMFWEILFNLFWTS